MAERPSATAMTRCPSRSKDWRRASRRDDSSSHTSISSVWVAIADATVAPCRPSGTRCTVLQRSPQVDELAQRSDGQPTPGPRLAACDPRPVVDRDLRRPRARGAALDEQLGAAEGAAGAEGPAGEEPAAAEPERAIDVAHRQVERRPQEAVPQLRLGARADRALR